MGSAGSRQPRDTLRVPAPPVAVWAATRAVLLLCVFKVLVLPGPDVTSDISGIYHGWSEVLKSGAFPQDDVAWQYPPAAALAVLSPGLLPFLDYASAFFVLACAADAVTFALLLYAGRRPGKRLTGAWVWTAGVALLGPTAYARYDLMVTAVAVAALFAAARHPRVSGALIAFGALLKVWPVLLLTGAPLRGRRARQLWGAAAVSALAITALCAAWAPGGLAFLTFQRDRGTEVESLGALVFHLARQFGWDGQVLLHYGSVEFVGPYVPLVSSLAQLLTVAAFGWLLLWRLRARRCTSATLADAAFTAVLLFVTTSRVISPQYMIWLVGAAAVCMTLRASRMGPPAVLVLHATGATLVEFPVRFVDVVASEGTGVVLLAVRNALLVAASLTAGRRLWRSTVTGPRRVTPAAAPRTPATAG
ncbi:glycosyltransferase family 87 protein [Streptomyces monomycini]|uniref:glycosyltransferase family 87 protein n=1 Tax=Streptomyces monomycini TaxID=371720 RepID=UPI0004ABAAD9|nr:glycosyltransferase family 87 protein [Streptomyces monomycini]